MKQITFAHDKKASILINMSNMNRILLPLALLIASLPLHGVTVDSNAIRNKAVFGLEFPGESRAFHGREANVQSISMQEYVTATFRVTEINIVTNGSALLRVYHTRPLRVGELQDALGDGAAAAGVPSSIIKTPMPESVNAMADRANKGFEAATSTTVIKDYPIATHARTIEYRLSKRAELIELHEELMKHWLKEPAFFEDGQIVEEDESTSSEMKPRSLGGTLFRIDS